jgi:hypothetical protein
MKRLYHYQNGTVKIRVKKYEPSEPSGRTGQTHQFLSDVVVPVVIPGLTRNPDDLDVTKSD